jgi:hypothetical protein
MLGHFNLGVTPIEKIGVGLSVPAFIALQNPISFTRLLSAKQ